MEYPAAKPEFDWYMLLVAIVVRDEDCIPENLDEAGHLKWDFIASRIEAFEEKEREMQPLLSRLLGNCGRILASECLSRQCCVGPRIFWIDAKMTLALPSGFKIH